MVKKLAFGLGVVVLAALGTAFAWKFLGDDGNKGALTLATQTLPQLTVANPPPSMTSPNGDYRIVVANTGITLVSPTGSAEIDNGGVLVKSSGNTVDVSPSSVDVSSSGPASFRGTQVRLGCNAGGQPVVRVGNAVQVSGTGGVGPDGGTFTVNSSGIIQQGSATVFAC